MGEQATADEENTEFEDAFVEFATQGDDDSAALPDNDSDESAGEAGSETSTTAEGEAEEASAEGSTDAAPGADKETSAGDENPFEGWPQEAIDRYQSQVKQTEQLQHRLQSDAGRVSAFQKKINGLEETIKEIQAGGKGDQPTDKEISDAMAGSEGDWEQFSEDYPEVAAAIDKRFEAQKGDVEKVIKPIVEKQQHEAQEQATAAELAAQKEVAKSYPKWQDEVKKQEYHDWYAAQSPGVRALGNSDDVQDASTLLGLYDNYRVANGKPTMKADPEPDTGVKNDNADELAERRRQQLEGGTTLPSKSARVTTDGPEGEDEFERSFNVFAARKEAKNRQ